MKNIIVKIDNFKKTVIIIVVLLSILDTITTWYLLTFHNFYEGNLVLNSILQRYGWEGFALAKLMVIALMPMYFVIRPHVPKINNFCTAVIIFAGLIAVLNNMFYIANL